jgi:hypothetical protein
MTDKKVKMGKLKKLKFIAVIIILVFSISCKKSDGPHNNNVNNDETYTDSFTPPDWENPLSRRNIKSGDKDIGVFIKKDVVDPKNRNLLLTVEQFIQFVKVNNAKEIEKLMLPSAYHSYILRYPDLSFKDDYTIRVEQPADIAKNPLWIQFKVILPEKSFIGKLEIEFTDDKCKIGDFDDDFFKGIKERNAN